MQGTRPVEPATSGLESPPELAFREAMRGFASTVVLVTTMVDSRPWGVTVTSVCALSVKPPRLLVSLMRHSTCCQSIAAAGMFGANVLAADQVAVARFGAKAGEPKFLSPDSLVPDPGVASPIVAGSLAYIQCAVAAIFDGGDHDIIVGDVVGIVGRDSVVHTPLVYFDGGFRHLGVPT